MPAKPVFGADGVTHVPAFDLPASELSSPEARAAQASRARMPGGAPRNDMPIEAVRRGIEMMLAPQVAEMRKRYPVDIADQLIDGVPTRIVKPAGRPL